MESLDMLANNLANASAPGFKADREFYSTYVAAEAAESSGTDLTASMPVIERQWTDYTQGSIAPTGNPLDVALEGKGFFVAGSPSGPLLTRDGSFRISSKNLLTTQDGFEIMGTDNKPIQVDPAKQLEISPSGAVRQDGQAIGQIQLLDVKDATTLSKHGMNYFDFSSGGVAPVTGSRLQAGSLETANFQPAESAVRLVSVMRQFEMLQRAVSIGADMGRRAVDEVAKVTS